MCSGDGIGLCATQYQVDRLDGFGAVYDRPAQQQRIPAYKPIRFHVLLARIESPALAVSYDETLDGQKPFSTWLPANSSPIKTLHSIAAL